MLIVLTTASDRALADALAERMVNERLAACVQILPKMTSVYFWEGETEKEDEHLLLIKTSREKYDAVEAFINENHNYDVPEIVAIESADVSDKYRTWLEGYLGG